MSRARVLRLGLKARARVGTRTRAGPWGPVLSISLPFECPAPIPGKFMVCTGHRLQCNMPNLTNHKFPGYGAEKFEGKRNQQYHEVGLGHES